MVYGQVGGQNVEDPVGPPGDEGVSNAPLALGPGQDGVPAAAKVGPMDAITAEGEIQLFVRGCLFISCEMNE